MLDSSRRKNMIWIARANLAIWASNAVVFGILILASLNVSNFFAIITLLETGLCFLVGGAIAFSSSASSNKAKEQIFKTEERWSIEKLRTSEKKANKYFLLAGILLVECLIVSLFGI